MLDGSTGHALRSLPPRCPTYQRRCAGSANSVIAGSKRCVDYCNVLKSSSAHSFGCSNPGRRRYHQRQAASWFRRRKQQGNLARRSTQYPELTRTCCSNNRSARAAFGQGVSNRGLLWFPQRCLTPLARLFRVIRKCQDHLITFQGTVFVGDNAGQQANAIRK